MPLEQLSVTNLSGYGAFSRVIISGRRYEKNPIKAFVRISPATKTSVRVGYTVAKGMKKAVHRNRLKRLMREAFRDRKVGFVSSIKSGTMFEIVFMYNGKADIEPNMVRFSSIDQAITSLCQMIMPLSPE